MRVVAILAVVAVLALIGLTFVPETTVPGLGLYHRQFILGALVAAAVALVAILADKGGKATEPKAVKAEALKPAPPPVAANQADAEVVSFLAALQEKGRFVDFLMEDITRYDDTQVAAAARVVNDGCKAVLKEHFSIRPIRDENEGAPVTVAAGYHADEYRLVGKIQGEAPFKGTLVHRGWKTESVKLPRVLRTGDDRLPTIAPAEVELK